jgi:uncharacterized protein YneF (UPF0154 family)
MKIQFGGLKIGFIKVGYQLSTLGLVTTLAEYPTNKQTIRAMAILTVLFILFYFSSKIVKRYLKPYSSF